MFLVESREKKESLQSTDATARLPTSSNQAKRDPNDKETYTSIAQWKVIL